MLSGADAEFLANVIEDDLALSSHENTVDMVLVPVGSEWLIDTTRHLTMQVPALVNLFDDTRLVQ